MKNAFLESFQTWISLDLREVIKDNQKSASLPTFDFKAIIDISYFSFKNFE